MNAELDHIKTFIQKHLDPCYYDIAEEQMLINPICGVVKKFTDKFKTKEKRIEKEKLTIKIKQDELKRKFEEIQKKEEQINAIISEKPELNYINKSADIDKLDEIKKIINHYFEENIDRKTRRREVVYARQMAMYYARILTKLSLSDIGSWIADRDHATVIHSVKTINNLSRYPKTQRHLKELNKIFGINE